MIKSIRHLRGSESDWKAHDTVIPDGEIAILKTRSGASKIKIGNGIDTFSALSSLTGDCIDSLGGDLNLMSGKSYRLGECQSLALQFPEIFDDDFYVEISFDSSLDGTEFTTSRKVRFSGDEVADEELLPNPKTHYTVFIWYDGDFQGVVRGIPNA